MGIFDNWDGGQSRSDIYDGQGKAKQIIHNGMRTGQDWLNRTHRRSMGYLNPYIQSGLEGSEYYDDLLGLNGWRSRDDAQDMLMRDKAFQGKLGQDQNAMLRAMNARGNSNSGAGALAAERVFQQNYGDVLNRYAGRAQQGYQAASQGAGLATQYGRDSANLQFGGRQQIAQNAITSANAIAGTRGTGMNNLLGIAGLGLKAYNTF